MYHTIEFGDDYLVDLEISPRQYLERLIVPKGARMRAEVRPYVVETDNGLIEVADLYFEDGTSTRAVRFECFGFVDS